MLPEDKASEDAVNNDAESGEAETPVTVEDKVEEQTNAVDAAVKNAANGTITMDELAAEIRALPEKLADVFKEMNPTPRKPADTPTAKPTAKPVAKPALKPTMPGKRTFAEWWL